MSEPGAVTVIDAGTGRTMLEALLERGVTTVDAALVSHADADHCAGLITLLLDRRLFVRHVLLNADSRTDSATWYALLRAIEVARSVKGTTFDFGLHDHTTVPSPHRVFRIEVLAPRDTLAARAGTGVDDAGRPWTANSASAVVRVFRNDEPLALFAGDIDWAGLESLLANGAEPRARVLVFPHHGGRPGAAGGAGAFAERLCRAVRPDAVIFSIARYSGRGKNPRPEVVAGVRAAAPDAHIVCTQLSQHCAAALPPPAAYGHLAPSVARGKIGLPGKNLCCGGSLELDGGAAHGLRAPQAAAHRAFVVMHAPTRLCG